MQGSVDFSLLDLSGVIQTCHEQSFINVRSVDKLSHMAVIHKQQQLLHKKFMILNLEEGQLLKFFHAALRGIFLSVQP